MVQTVHSETLHPGQKKILFEKPRSLQRIFGSVWVVRAPNEWGASILSFDDPMFTSYYVLDGPSRYFEMKGEGIFQGNIWVKNVATLDLLFSITEVLV